MARLSHSVAKELRVDTDQEVQQRTFRDCLVRIADPKAWASALNVTDRQIRRWAQGDQEIPPLRRDQILRQAKTFLMASRRIEEIIDRCLLETYGSKESM